jgi:hypothetical protein
MIGFEPGFKVRCIGVLPDNTFDVGQEYLATPVAGGCFGIYRNPRRPDNHTSVLHTDFSRCFEPLGQKMKAKMQGATIPLL